MARKYENRGRDQINIENGNVLIQNQSVQRQNEQLILKKVNLEVNSRLEDSLHNRIFVNLDKQSRPEQVERLWDAQIKIGAKAPVTIPPNTSILEMFETPDIAGNLLILGDLGAGKTTTMLDLAKSLIEKAEQDYDEPIPVIINLSSWKNIRQSMTDWLIEELNSKYRISKEIFGKCLENKKLLPMLDGLDEVKPELQESCIDAINLWLNNDLSPLFIVICSRQEEYANHQAQLDLNGAILLESLTDHQIKSYLTNVNRNELWDLLQSNPELLELVRTPLLLSITILSYSELSLDEWHKQSSTEHLIELLLDAYIQSMFYRKFEHISYKKCKFPSTDQTKYWLKFLALQMLKDSQTEFLIEKMQPELWLSGKQKKFYTVIIGSIIGLVIGISFSLLYGQVMGWILGVFIAASSHLKIKLVEIFNWSFKRFKKAVVIWLIPWSIIILIIGIIGGFILGMRHGLVYGILMMVFFVLIMGVIYGLMGLLVGFAIGFTGLEVDTKSFPNQGIWRSAKNAFYAFTLCLLTFVILSIFFSLINTIFVGEIIDGVSYGLINGLVYGVLFGQLFALEFGGLAFIQHFILRIVLFFTGFVPWNYPRFLNYCTERLFLQRIGGRYRFVHKLLQEHFAEMDI